MSGSRWSTRAVLRRALVPGACVSVLAVGGAFALPKATSTSDYVRGVEVVKAISLKDTKSNKDMYVQCPPGKKAIGGGADVDSAFTGRQPNAISVVALRTSQPSNGLLPVPEASAGPPAKGWHASAMETTPTSLTWTLTVHAICADVGAPGPAEPPAFSDLEVDKSYTNEVGPSEGESARWVVTVRNLGPELNPGVMITDASEPPADLDPSNSDPRCSQATSGGPVTCAVGDLAPGDAESVDIAFITPSGHPYFGDCATADGQAKDVARANNEACDFQDVSE